MSLNGTKEKRRNNAHVKRLYKQAHIASRSIYVTMMHCSRTVCIRAFNVQKNISVVHTPRSSNFPHVALGSRTYKVQTRYSQLQIYAALTFSDSHGISAENLVPDRKGTAVFHGRSRRLIAAPYNHTVASSAPCVLDRVDVVVTGRYRHLANQSSATRSEACQLYTATYKLLGQCGPSKI